MQKILVLPLIFVLSACSGINFNTNIGPYATNRVKTVLVEEYSPEEIGRYDATFLGIVEASYCQERIDEQKPNKSILVKDLKLKTHNLGGNGVVVEACGKSPVYGTCQAYMECRGVAYSVPARRTMP
jgi:hypothetical protein